MYTLYIANKNYSSWSLRPWVLMSELSIPFIEKLVPFDNTKKIGGTQFLGFSPSGKVPCLHDNNVIVWDSLAITEYLAERYPQVWPESTQARAWARCAAAEMHAGFSELRQHCTMNCGIRVRIDTITEPLMDDINRIDQLWNQSLDQFGGPYLAGNTFSAVDAFFAPVAFRIQTYHLPLSQKALEYSQRLLSLPSMQAWEAAALAEPWREPEHEKEAQQAGTLLEDRRKNSL